MIIEESIILAEPFEVVLSKVKDAFAAEGFGVLTEIDLQATLHDKIGKNIDRHVILGACNPRLAGRALDAEAKIGVMLPCNVVVRETVAGVAVDALDPGLMSSLTGNEDMASIADEARQLVNNALDQLR